MLDTTITLEGLFTYVLFTKIVKDETKDDVAYYFLTNSDGTCTAKSPMNMFPKLIDNDLKIVVDTIIKYNEGE